MPSTIRCPRCKVLIPAVFTGVHFCATCFHLVHDYGVLAGERGGYTIMKMKPTHRKCLDNCKHYKGALTCAVQDVAFIKGCDTYQRARTRQLKITSWLVPRE